MRGEYRLRIVLVISYIGTNYCGWQEQEGSATVQQVVQEAIYKLTGERVKLYGSGRTDSGVHAYRQVAHFDTGCKIAPTKIAFALNQYLPSDVRIIASNSSSSNFNARFDVKRKTYAYKFYCSKIELPFDALRAYQVPFELDESKMRQCAKLFVGTYDFTPFCKVDKQEKDRVRTIYSCKLIKTNENHFEVEVCGNGFLHNMVRILVGTIIDVGVGKLSLKDIKAILNASTVTAQKGINNLSFMQKASLRQRTGRTLPPYGLYLKNVEY